jgi:hypothetical protein
MSAHLTGFMPKTTTQILINGDVTLKAFSKMSFLSVLADNNFNKNDNNT